MTKLNIKLKNYDELKSLIESSARKAGFQGEKRKRNDKIVKTVKDLMRHGKFIDSIINQYRKRGIMKALGTALGASPNRVGEWHKIYLGCIYTQDTNVKSLLQSDDDISLIKLLNALKASGWHAGQSVNVDVNMSIINSSDEIAQTKRKSTQRRRQQHHGIESHVVTAVVDDRPLKYTSRIQGNSESVSDYQHQSSPPFTCIDMNDHSSSHNQSYNGHDNACHNDYRISVGHNYHNNNRNNNDNIIGGCASYYENHSHYSNSVGTSEEDVASVFTLAAATWILEPDAKRDLDDLSPFDLNSPTYVPSQPN